ncbi:unnamed protein product [Hermetia illucens]|uniref:Uncharacterized protein n=1 Tax=Hermetia illucens TaxID=343691 RepID=A0A7R8YVH7_HERIL|nr:unnamed protein product [Hermetia illucens]
MDELFAQYLFFAMVFVWSLTIYFLTYEYISEMFTLKSLKSKMCKSGADANGYRTKKIDNTSWDNYEGEEIRIKALTFGMIQPLLQPSYGRMCPAAPRFKQPTSPGRFVNYMPVMNQNFDLSVLYTDPVKELSKPTEERRWRRKDRTGARRCLIF